MLTKQEIEYIQAAPGPGIVFQTLNDVLQLEGWNNPTHKGWACWAVEQSLIAKGLLVKVSGGRGRGRKNHFMLKAL